MTRRRRLILRVVAGLAIVPFGSAGAAAALGTVTSDTAQAATAYRYWAYYVAVGGSWHYSQRGPASEYPVDGEVQGWRFAVQADAGTGLPPRATPDFATLCSATPPQPGQLRVGIVVDFGSAGDAPPGEHPPAGTVPGCVRVADGASGAVVLQAALGAGAVRLGTGADAGLVCGLDGYPSSECAVVVQPRRPSATPTRTDPPTARPVAATAATPSPPPQATQRPRPTPTPNTSAPATARSIPPASIPAVPSTAAAASRSATVALTTASASSLATLRATAVRRHGFPAAALVGGLLVVGLGGAAAWRARAGRR
jgi:hypothetical protein